MPSGDHYHRWPGSAGDYCGPAARCYTTVCEKQHPTCVANADCAAGTTCDMPIAITPASPDGTACPIAGRSRDVGTVRDQS